MHASLQVRFLRATRKERFVLHIPYSMYQMAAHIHFQQGHVRRIDGITNDGIISHIIQ